jgi:uncharacterized protein YigA (DUF484 family)
MTPDAVASYLKDHPEFFEEYAELLAAIYVPHPHGGRAIPIAERQILTLRDKSKLLESKLSELIQYGEENDVISEKLHRSTLALAGARDVQSLLRALRYEMSETFAVPHAALRLWYADADSSLPEAAAVSPEVRQFAETLGDPHCTGHAMLDTAQWFGEDGVRLKSFAYVPLRSGDRTLGLLALASEDAQRFYPEMGTLYLKRLGELLSTTLARLLI